MKQAINAPRQNLFLVYPEDLLLIGRDTKDTPAHPRYDVRVHNEFEENVVQGMMDYGCQEAIKVVKNGDVLEVVDGRQRTINAREANRRLEEQGAPKIRVKVIIVRGEDLRLAALTVLLNEHRVDDSAFGRGQKAQKLLDMGHPIESVAMFFKVSVTTINNYTSLLGLLPEIQTMIVEGKVAASKGYKLAQKSRDEQQAFLEGRTGGRSNEPSAKPKAPSRKVLQKILDEGQKVLSKEFLQGIQFAMGLIDEDALPGVSAILSPSPFKVSPPTPNLMTG
jgi:ParB family chromosome partitioning protein